jgi:hypothetical protein
MGGRGRVNPPYYIFLSLDITAGTSLREGSYYIFLASVIALTEISHLAHMINSTI